MNGEEDTSNTAPLKVVAFNGSARLDGNTAALIRRVLIELEREGIKTELVQLAGQQIRGCRVCRRCYKALDGRCANGEDRVNEYIQKMLGSDGIILGSPVYFSTMTPELKALIDRAGMVSKANSDMLRRKVGAAVVAVRRAGAVLTFDSINNFFLINQMVVPGSSYWNMSLAHKRGDAERDEEGMETMRVLGQNMAWLLKRIRSGA